jgi:hypothetical protein
VTTVAEVAANKSGVTTLDLVLFALLTCDGDQAFIGTDEVAIQAFRLFPLKFCWDTFAHLPNWDRVRQWLSEAKKEKHGALIEGFSGDKKEGWKLTPAGVRRLRFKRPLLDGLQVAAALEERYVHLPTIDLVAYAADELRRSARPPSLPALTESCLRRFPALFELPGYAGWPDSATVADAVRVATTEGLFEQAKGKETAVSLTDLGTKRANDVRRVVDADTIALRMDDIGRGLTHRAARAVNELTASRAWSTFGAGKPISDGLACEALQCTLQSHPKAIRRALDRYLGAATELNRPDVVAFLKACAESLAISTR